jgi:diacylglycerol kinase family enzyme
VTSPFGPLVLIANPRAGRGKGDAALPRVERVLRDEGLGTPIAPDAVLGVVAAGSGCDFVRTFGLPGDAGPAASRLAGDRVRVIDVGTVDSGRPFPVEAYGEIVGTTPVSFGIIPGVIRLKV